MKQSDLFKLDGSTGGKTVSGWRHPVPSAVRKARASHVRSDVQLPVPEQLQIANLAVLKLIHESYGDKDTLFESDGSLLASLSRVNEAIHPEKSMGNRLHRII